MAASVTVIIVGVLMFSGGQWPVGYPLACVLGGALWWHGAEHARRMRLAGCAPVSQRLAAARKALGMVAASLEVAAILIVGASLFDRPDLGLLHGLDVGALVGLGFGLAMLAGAAQLNALRLGLREEALSALLARGGRADPALK